MLRRSVSKSPSSTHIFWARLSVVPTYLQSWPWKVRWGVCSAKVAWSEEQRTGSPSKQEQQVRTVFWLIWHGAGEWLPGQTPGLVLHNPQEFLSPSLAFIQDMFVCCCFLLHIQFMHPVSERMSVPGLFASVLEEEGHWRCSGGEPGMGQLSAWTSEKEQRNGTRLSYQHTAISIPVLIKLKLSPQWVSGKCKICLSFLPIHTFWVGRKPKGMEVS